MGDVILDAQYDAAELETRRRLASCLGRGSVGLREVVAMEYVIQQSFWRRRTAVYVEDYRQLGQDTGLGSHAHATFRRLRNKNMIGKLLPNWYGINVLFDRWDVRERLRDFSAVPDGEEQRLLKFDPSIRHLLVSVFVESFDPREKNLPLRPSSSTRGLLPAQQNSPAGAGANPGEGEIGGVARAESSATHLPASDRSSGPAPRSLSDHPAETPAVQAKARGWSLEDARRELALFRERLGTELAPVPEMGTVPKTGTEPERTRSGYGGAVPETGTGGKPSAASGVSPVPVSGTPSRARARAFESSIRIESGERSFDSNKSVPDSGTAAGAGQDWLLDPYVREKLSQRPRLSEELMNASSFLTQSFDLLWKNNPDRARQELAKACDPSVRNANAWLNVAVQVALGARELPAAKERPRA
jgi:hypothetical protein